MASKIVIEALAFEDGKAYGFQEYLFNLLEYFYENLDSFESNEIYIACDNIQSEYFLKFAPKIKIVTFNSSNYLNKLMSLEKISKKLNLNSNDIILFTGNYSSLTKKCKHILVIHDLLYLNPSLFRKNLHSLIFILQRHLYLTISISRADKIIAISDFTKKNLIKKFPRTISKIHTVKNYFNFSKFDNISSLKLMESPYFLTICSSAYHKNITFTIDAFVEFCRSDSDYKLVIVGSLNKILSNYIKELPIEVQKNIINFKHIQNKDLANLYKNARCFISSSKYEGLGMPVVEALFFEVPSLLSDIEVHREVSLDSASYFNLNDVNELINLMKSLKSYYSKEFLRKKIITEYSSMNTSHKYVDIINSLTDKIIK